MGLKMLHREPITKEKNSNCTVSREKLTPSLAPQAHRARGQGAP